MSPPATAPGQGRRPRSSSESGSGSATLNFTYTVGAGDTSPDLDYVATNSLALNGGTITDAAGNSAVLTLASHGAANSLGANKALVIDTTAPTVSGVNSLTANGTYKVPNPISIQVTVKTFPEHARIFMPAGRWG